MSETGRTEYAAPDRAAEQMAAATDHIAAQIRNRIQDADDRGTELSAEAVLALVESIGETFRLMIPE